MVNAKSDTQQTNDLLEKLIIVELRGQGVGIEQISKFVGKRKQWVNDQLKLLRSGKKLNEPTE